MTRTKSAPVRATSLRARFPVEAIRTALGKQLASAGLTHTRRREAVVDVLLASRGHETTEELVAHFAGLGMDVGPAVVSTAMALVTQLRLAGRRPPANEPSSCARLVCDLCGRVEEFTDAELTETQAAVAQLNGFALEGHVFELHGRCRRCRGHARRAS